MSAISQSPIRPCAEQNYQKLTYWIAAGKSGHFVPAEPPELVLSHQGTRNKEGPPPS